MREHHRRLLAIFAAKARRGGAAAQVVRYVHRAFAPCVGTQVGCVNELSIAVAGVAARVGFGAIVFRLALIDEGPIAHRAVLLHVPEAAIGGAAKVIAVEVACEGFAAAQMNDAGQCLVATAIHFVPLAAVARFDDLLPALFHAIEITRPGEGIMRQAASAPLRQVEDRRVLDDVFIARDDAILAKEQPRHVGVEGVPLSAVLDLAIGVSRKGPAARIHTQRAEIDFIPCMHRSAQSIAIGKTTACCVINHHLVVVVFRTGHFARHETFLWRVQMKLVREQPLIERDRAVLIAGFVGRQQPGGEVHAASRCLKRAFTGIVRMIRAKGGIADTCGRNRRAGEKSNDDESRQRAHEEPPACHRTCC